MEYIREVFVSADTIKTTGLPFGLVHGDLWTNNMLFRLEELFFTLIHFFHLSQGPG